MVFELRLSVRDQNMKNQNNRARVIVALSVFFAWSLLWHPGQSYADETETMLVSVFKFAGGVISAFAIHEGAHFAAGQITGTSLDWRVGSFAQPIEYEENAKDDSDGLIVASVGLVAQLAGSEVILNVDRIDKNDAFVRGMMAWNIFNPIMYALDYWFIHNINDKNGDSYQGDLQGIEYYSSERTANIFAGGMVALATFQGYRFLKTQTWAPEWIKDNTQNLHFAGTPEGGFFLGLKIDF
jgi:hypothetical protein